MLVAHVGWVVHLSRVFLPSMNCCNDCSSGDRNSCNSLLTKLIPSSVGMFHLILASSTLHDTPQSYWGNNQIEIHCVTLRKKNTSPYAPTCILPYSWNLPWQNCFVISVNWHAVMGKCFSNFLKCNLCQCWTHVHTIGRISWRPTCTCTCRS